MSTRFLLPVLLLWAGAVVNHLESVEGLTDSLSHYELLHHRHLKINHRTTRSLTSRPQDVSFTVLGRFFHLQLFPQRNLFHHDFTAHTSSAPGEKESFSIDQSQFTEGHLSGNKSSSKVFAYFEGKNLMATIVTQEDTYVIEPLWRHQPETKSHTMIAYRKSDMLFDKDKSRHSFCGYATPPDEGSESDSHYFQSKKKTKREEGKTWTSQEYHRGGAGRVKRQASDEHVVCTLALVADHHFHLNVGQNDALTTANYIVGQIQKVNAIYKATDFNGHKGVGFEIHSVLIYTKPTPVKAGQVHHNMDKVDWDFQELLKAFSLDPNHASVCLAHLFTSIAFSNGVLGLAYVAPPRGEGLGGICSEGGGTYIYNTGWTTALTAQRGNLPTLEATLVTAHEFGHNWGSPHDPDADDCIPGSNDGGRYLMYTYSLSGQDPNNNDFSPCSRKSIGAVLNIKRESCFRASRKSFCGNTMVEPPYEECDPGLAGSDTCCEIDCQLKPGAICSDVNDPCCDGCNVALAGKVCHGVGHLETVCEEDAVCDGNSTSCPANSPKPDGTPCIGGGECKGGVCLSFCETQGLTPCACDDVLTSCLTCCHSGSTNQCKPYLDVNGTTRTLQNGLPCIQGTCKNGVCMKIVVKTIERLWDVIQHLEISQLVEFFKRQIVLTVIVMSLIIYIPCCIIICIADWRRHKAEKKEDSWYSSRNSTLSMVDRPAAGRSGVPRRRVVPSREGTLGTGGRG